MEKPPLQSSMNNGDISSIARPWMQWFTRLWILADSIDSKGTTAQRPTIGLFVGRGYFDTTLGYKIWLKSVNPTIWVNGAGTAV